MFIITKKWKQLKCPSTDEWKNKTVCSYNGILFNSKRKWSISTCYNIYKHWKHNLKSKKPVTNDHILYMIPLMWDIQNLLTQKVDKWFSNARRWNSDMGGKGVTAKGYGLAFGGW